MSALAGENVANNGIFDLDRNLVTTGFLDGNGSLSVGITNQTNPLAVQKIISNAPLNGDEFVVVASNGGQEVDPAWWRNLQQTPEAQVQVGRETFRVRARLAGDNDLLGFRQTEIERRGKLRNRCALRSQPLRKRPNRLMQRSCTF